MVKVIKYEQKRRTLCQNCGAILEFEAENIKSTQTRINEYIQEI